MILVRQPFLHTVTPRGMWSSVYSAAFKDHFICRRGGAGGHRFSRSTEGISRRLQSVEEGDYGRLGAN